MNHIVKNNDRRLLLFLLLPFAFVAILGVFYITGSNSYLKEIVGFACVTLLFLSCALFLRGTKLYRTSILLGYALLAFFAFVKISFYKFYGVRISASALFVIFETNTQEASGYLQNYFDATALAYVSILILVLGLLIYQLLRSPYRAPSFSLSLYKLIYIIISVGCLYTIHKHYRNENIMYATLSSWQEYHTAKKNLKAQLAHPTSTAFSNVQAIVGPQTYVVVIGESTSRGHMQLYGYPRETNPRLTEITEELTVFDSVISPHVHTITALEKILTLANNEAKNPKENGSIIQLANMAGFTTYWVSNQKPVGVFESIPTILGSAASHTRFLATNDYNYGIHDGSVLPALDKALADTSTTKKVIFIHLMGTHVRYEKRYPDNFQAFNDTLKGLKFPSSKAIETTNRYDTAVRYNDYVLREIIESLRNEKGMVAMTYFSDHGEEVYDTMDFVGHNEYHGTKAMYEVPLIFWFSGTYIENSSLAGHQNISKRYTLEHFPHTFAQMSHITFDGYDATRSLLDSSYTVRKRIIKDIIDYDAQ